MTEQGSQFTCPQCGKPQFTAEFGFERHHHPTNEIQDPCVFCGESTAAGGMNRLDPNDEDPVKGLVSRMPIINPKFINRIPADNYDDETGEYKDGYACADCMARPCNGCDKMIPLDEDVKDNDFYDYHEECLKPHLPHNCGPECECGINE